MKKSLNAWSVPSEVGFEEMFVSLKKAGFDAVELNLDAPGAGNHALSLETTDEELANIREMSERAGLPVCSVSSSQWGNSTLGSKNGKIPAPVLMKKQIECARALGADGILVVPGGIGEDCSITEAWQNVREQLESCRELIENGGVKVGLENVWNNFFLSPMEMAGLIDEMHMKNLGAYFDVGNVVLLSYPEYWIDVLGSRIVKIHVKDFARAGWNAGHFVNLLEGSVRWEKVIPALRKAGYDGYLTAELSAMPKTPEYLYESTVKALDTILAM